MNVLGSRVRKALFFISAFAVLGVIAICVTRWIAYESMAYKVAVGFVESSNRLAAITGHIKSTRLSWVEHTSVEEVQINGTPSGSAQFTIVAEGSAATVSVEIKLIRDTGGWRVTQALAGSHPLN